MSAGLGNAGRFENERQFGKRRPCTTYSCEKDYREQIAGVGLTRSAGLSNPKADTTLQMAGEMSVAENLTREAGQDFIRDIVRADLASGRHKTAVTRFPPEPNGYLHIGHAKSICLNFGIADENAGTCNLRFDDTNPTKEDVEYVDAIKEDVEWLGFKWHALYYASDYFERLYQFAVELIKQRKAYVDSLSADEIRSSRGTLTEPGRNSPYRDRSIEENLDLFARMRAAEFPDGAHVLRAK